MLAPTSDNSDLLAQPPMRPVHYSARTVAGDLRVPLCMDAAAATALGAAYDPEAWAASDDAIRPDPMRLLVYAETEDGVTCDGCLGWLHA